MIVQFNTDNTMNGADRVSTYFSDLIAKDLSHFESHISRVEVHLSDQNGQKEGPDDLKCVMEARIDGKAPIAVSANADTDKKAILAASKKLKGAVRKTIDKMRGK